MKFFKHSFTARRLALSVIGVSLLGGALTACVPLVIGGAVGGGALVVTDRRTSGTQLEDEGIELRALSRLRNEVGERSHVNLTSYSRQVLLTGEAATAQDKQLIEQIVSRVENVRSIVNADRVTDVVRGTPGVQKVVRILEIITPEELARIQSSPLK